MTEVLRLQHYCRDGWTSSGQDGELRSAIDGAVVARLPGSVDPAGMIAHARKVGGPALRSMTFRQRGKMLRGLAEALSARKEDLYELSCFTGATRSDSAFDIDGGIGVLFVYASKAKAMPDAHVLLDGERETISKGDFLGRHILSPLTGAALHINAYNFPVWGMLEKLAPTLLAGMPAIVKPASPGAYLAEAAFRIMTESGHLPPGAVQLLLGEPRNLLDQLDGQDSVAFTGSAATACLLKSNPAVVANAIRFTAEQDSLNASILGPDASPGDPEFDLFVKEAAREITQKAGQKCTAIRRILVPAALIDPVQEALVARLAKLKPGDPRDETTRMGALAGIEQRADMMANLENLKSEASIVAGGNIPELAGSLGEGAFFEATLLRCDRPLSAEKVHSIEAFGPVATLMPYTDVEEAIILANAGKGSLVLSVFSRERSLMRAIVAGAAAFHGRILLVDRDSAPHSTGHGAALPHLQHGGPGRAGGGAELGGIIGMAPYLQRTALQSGERLLAELEEI